MGTQLRYFILAAPAHLVSIVSLEHSHNVTDLDRMAVIWRDKNSH